MSLPLPGGSKTVLLLADDGLYIYTSSSGAVSFVDNVDWGAEAFVATVVNIIQKTCRGRPLLIVNDMTDQMFKGGQRVPKVGILDKAGVVKRKLQVAFPSYPIRGALPIKLPKTEDSTGANRVVYLFAAVPSSEYILKTQNVVRASMLDASGFVLLPAESADMVTTLSKKAFGKRKETPKWVMFLGLHRSGALRQVITRDGQLAMTRMTPVTSNPSDHGKWAHEVNQDIKATLGYLSRFGFSPEDGVDLIVIAESQAGASLEAFLEIECNFKALDVKAAAKLLGLKTNRKEPAYYADTLHVSWIAKKSKFTMPMSVPELDRIRQPRQIASLLMFGMLGGIAYLGWLMSTNYLSMMDSKENIRIQSNVLIQAQEEYDFEANRMRDLGYDVRLLKAAISSFNDFEKERMPIIPLLVGISEGVGGNIHLDSLTITKDDGTDGEIMYDEFGMEIPPKQNFEAKLMLSFPSEVRPEIGILEVNGLRSRLQSMFTDYVVEVEKQVARPEYTQDASGVAGRILQSGEDGGVPEDYVAELVIRGAI